MSDKEKCPMCESEINSGRYGLFDALTQFAEKHGWLIKAASYSRPAVTPCTKGEHVWEGRRLAGIRFRHCNKCGLTQRQLYEPYFVDHQFNISDKEWSGSEKCSTEDLKPGMAHAWH